MAGKLAGRVAIVTGAGSGIGQATAARLAAEGAFVVVNDLVEERSEKSAARIREDGGQAEPCPGDVTESSFVDALVDGAVARHGHLDVFHSNAGFGAARDELAAISDKAWHTDIELNLTSMFYCVRAAVRAMREAGGGSVVCTSSASALGAVSGTGPYSTAKAAILQLVRYAAIEYGPSGVRVNAVIPGAVKTEAFMGYIGTEERLARYEGQIPLRRACRPEDIANAVLWLASDESACVTGTGLVVDGGASAKRAEPHID